MTDQNNAAPSAPSSAPNVQITQHGGTTRATVSRETPSTDAPAQRTPTSLSSEFAPGRHSVTVKDGVTSYQHSGVQRASSGMSDRADTGLTFQTAALGSRVSAADAKDSDIVTLPGGMQTSVKAAINAKLLDPNFRSVASLGEPRGNASGNPTPGEANARNAAESTEQHQQQPTESAASAGHTAERYAELQNNPRAGLDSDVPVPLSTPAEQLMTHVTSRVQPSLYQSAVAEILAGKEVSAGNVTRLAESLSVDTDTAKATIQALHTEFSQQATRAIGQDALSWAKERMPDTLRQAALEQATSGTLKGYGRIHSEFIKALPDVNPNAILNSPDAAARGVRREQDGSITLEIPGHGRMSFRQAVAMRLINPHFKN